MHRKAARNRTFNDNDDKADDNLRKPDDRKKQGYKELWTDGSREGEIQKFVLWWREIEVGVILLQKVKIK